MLAAVRVRAVGPTLAAAISGRSASAGLRAFSGASPSEEKKPESEEPTGAGAEGEAAPGAAPTAASPYSPAATAFLTGDRSAFPRFLPRLKRSELGSFGDARVQGDFMEEAGNYPTLPADGPLYNLRDSVPEAFLPHGVELDRLRAAKASLGPEASVPEVLLAAGLVGPQGAEALARDLAAGSVEDPDAILTWETRVTLATGVQETHPANRKAKASVNLRELQRTQGVSDRGLRIIALVAGPRYDDTTGTLTITADSFPTVDENRAEIARILRELVDEGKRAEAKN